MKKKKNKPNLKSLMGFFESITYSLVFVAGLILLIYGMHLYGIGAHNLDLGHNVRIINLEFDLSLKDMNNADKIWSASTMYRVGFRQINRLYD